MCYDASLPGLVHSEGGFVGKQGSWPSGSAASTHECVLLADLMLDRICIMHGSRTNQHN